jgi:hypothetical protein
MSTPKHTPARLEYFKEIDVRHNTLTGERQDELRHWIRLDGEKYGVFALMACQSLNPELDAQRIVDLWNACEGINPAAVPGAFEALQLLIDDNRLMNAMSKEQARAIMDALKLAKGE